MQSVIIGVDFDNTIVCYHDVFHQVALERDLICPDFPKNKEAIRDYLRKMNKEDQWTEMQGQVYGKDMGVAKAFPGAHEFFKKMRKEKIKTVIVSHKTRYPYLGSKYDLHDAGRAWVKNSGLCVDQIFFLESKQEKIQQIAKCACTYFIDDLPEILLHNEFPKVTQKILFSPFHESKNMEKEITIFSNWYEISNYFAQVLYV